MPLFATKENAILLSPLHSLPQRQYVSSISSSACECHLLLQISQQPCMLVSRERVHCTRPPQLHLPPITYQSHVSWSSACTVLVTQPWCCQPFSSVSSVILNVPMSIGFSPCMMAILKAMDLYQCKSLVDTEKCMLLVFSCYISVVIGISTYLISYESGLYAIHYHPYDLVVSASASYALFLVNTCIDEDYNSSLNTWRLCA